MIIWYSKKEKNEIKSLFDNNFDKCCQFKKYFWKTIKSTFNSDFMKTFLVFLILKIFYYLSIRNVRNFFYNHSQTHIKFIIKFKKHFEKSEKLFIVFFEEIFDR